LDEWFSNQKVSRGKIGEVWIIGKNTEGSSQSKSVQEKNWMYVNH